MSGEIDENEALGLLCREKTMKMKPWACYAGEKSMKRSLGLIMPGKINGNESLGLSCAPCLKKRHVLKKPYKQIPCSWGGQNGCFGPRTVLFCFTALKRAGVLKQNGVFNTVLLCFRNIFRQRYH